MSIFVETALVVILGGVAAILIAVGVRLFRAAGGRQTSFEDARLIQEVFQGLSRLERRVEALETILFDRRGEDQRE